MRIIVPSRLNIWKNWLPFSLLALAWFLANFSSLQWLLRSLEWRSQSHLILAGMLLVAIGFYLVRSRQHSPTPWVEPLTLRFLPLTLLLGSSTLAIGCQWLLDLRQMTILLFAIGTYGLLGLVMPPTLWHRGLPVALLVACLLPFSSEFGTGLGFPARVLTAQMVEHVLSLWQVAAVSSHDIILLENGIAHVDSPCSGMKSLWTGSLFLLAATWLEHRWLGVRWLLVWGLTLFLLISANLLRVLLLVLITAVLKQPQVAHLLHVPLGLLGFVAACGLGWGALQGVPRQDRQIVAAIASPAQILHPKRLILVGLLATILAQGLLLQGISASRSTLPIAPLVWPTQMVSHPIPLTEAEQGLFASRSALVTEKRRFVSTEGLSGSLLVLGGTNWSTYHAPELCFVGNGLRVDRMEVRQLAPDLPARWLSLQQDQLSAAYWFQSAQRTTDNFLSRIWSQMFERDRRWFLVSILFDQTYSPTDSRLQSFVTTIHQTVRQSLTGAQL
ncbi:exosortase O [Leptolyngbya sp. 'hensonii']|uniref:exosortase O n=1 Tax=Leptolyngbya sp. 'hensonii' TaxID=1922337 RepID=UPI00094F8138|nr:exosortase O [Leptolyngbya sp. 'hensonii']OLP16530.1 exosortase O [Leptolyngbya sp. 'hensonii']